jgi:Holliday junction resolvasome RuvABC endonuclease subunit
MAGGASLDADVLEVSGRDVRRGPVAVRSRRIEPVVLGLDLSLKRSAAVCIPARWELGRWRDLGVESYPTDDPEPAPPERQQVERTERIEYVAQNVLDFVLRCRPTHVYVEDYGFSYNSQGVTALAELRGVVRRNVWLETRKMLVPVSTSAVRRVLLGRNAKHAKVLVQQAFYGAGAPFDNDDECDAAAVAAYGLSELGLTTISFAQ